jgi:hypothetical protein
MSRAALAFAAALGLAACTSATRRAPPPLADQVSNGDRDPRQVLISELQGEVLEGYERDEPPELESAVLPLIGAARIGVGPGDILVDQELVNSSSRWPLLIDPSTRTSVRSKHLAVQLADDRSAGWIVDEVSWRLETCGRTLVIPLRVTAMYARDGDRWVLAVEHVSSGAEPPADGPLIGRPIPSAEVSRAIGEDVARSVEVALQSPIASSPLLGTGPDAVLLGPSWAQEWRGGDIVGQQLVTGALTVEDRRIGVVGHDPDSATVAYWIGNLVATDPSGARTRLRATFVLEHQVADPEARQPPRRWVVVQGHVSLPVDDETLARQSVGSALVSLNPLVTQCGEQARGLSDSISAPAAPAR